MTSCSNDNIVNINTQLIGVLFFGFCRPVFSSPLFFGIHRVFGSGIISLLLPKGSKNNTDKVIKLRRSKIYALCNAPHHRTVEAERQLNCLLFFHVLEARFSITRK